MRLDGQIATDADHIRVSPLGQGGTEVRVPAVPGVGHHDRRHQLPPGRFIQGVQCQPPPLPVPDVLRDAGPVAPDGVPRPLLGQEQPSVERARGSVGDRVVHFMRVHRLTMPLNTAGRQT
jgi:hypothetical protein